LQLIDRLAALHPEASRRTMKQWLAAGRVRLNGEVVRRGTADTAPGDRIALGVAAPAALPEKLRIVHENERLLVVDKPAGLLTIATTKERTRTAYRVLSDHLAGRDHGRERAKPLFVVHRLDRETSGLLVFAKSEAVKHALQDQFKQHTAERLYLAVVEGLVRDDAGTVELRLHEDSGLRVRVARGDEGRPATTHYRVLARGADTTRLEVRLETGRRGQIRAHLAAIGHPILGDAAYGSQRDPLRRVCLHASRLGFVDEGRRVEFTSPAPAGFAKRLAATPAPGAIPSATATPRLRRGRPRSRAR
jgi:23S rRNA pseudouridine1911/1915/1917 synthase